MHQTETKKVSSSGIRENNLSSIAFAVECAPESGQIGCGGAGRRDRRRHTDLSHRSETQLDWPAYLSPKAPLQPWFLMAAKLVSNAGASVLVHGGTGLASEGLEAAADFLGIRVASGIDDAGSAVSERGIAYLPFSILSDQLTALIGLYRLFEMRSPLNQAVHLIKP